MPVQLKFSATGPNRADIKSGLSPKRWAKKIKEELRIPLRRAGNIYKKTVLTAMNSRGASVGQSWKPLAPFTVLKKGHDVPLIETSEYLNSFIVKVDKENISVTVGPPKGAIHSSAGIPLELIATLHEFGFINAKTGKMVPARPHIEPSGKKAAPEIIKIIQKGVTKAIGKAVKPLQKKRNIAGE